jgi:hypothetical protein
VAVGNADPLVGSAFLFVSWGWLSKPDFITYKKDFQKIFDK